MSDRQHVEAARRRMVERDLRRRGIRSTRVLDAMGRVPREEFVPYMSIGEAYADQALPIDCEQTISQPYMVALMTEALQLEGREKVLEIGAGSGYQTAVLAELAGRVWSIERHEGLYLQASQILQRLGYTNVSLIVGDGSRGWPEQAPFERILITAAAAECPPALFEQLAEGGILVGPFGEPEVQTLQVIRKVNGAPQSESLTACRFVPLVEGSPTR